MKPRDMAIVGVGLSLFLAGGAFAADVTWDGSENTDFNEPRNWDTGNVPTSSDKAIIDGTPSNQPVMDADQEVAQLEVQNGAVLQTGANTLTINGVGGMDVQSGGELEVSASGGMVKLTGGGLAHTVDGLLTLKVSGAKLRIDGADATVGGNGDVVGENNSAEVQIDADYVFTSELLIRGGLKIVGDVARGGETDNGKFLNHGTVKANGGNTIEMAADTLFDDNSSALWFATGNSSKLWFRRAQTGLEGDFKIDGAISSGSPCPTLRFDVNITTSGAFGPAFSKSGCVDVNSASFSFNGGSISSDTPYNSCSCP